MPGKFAPEKGRQKLELTEAEAQAVLDSDEPGSVLAERYGVSRNVIYAVQKRKTFKHLTRTKPYDPEAKARLQAERAKASAAKASAAARAKRQAKKGS